MKNSDLGGVRHDKVGGGSHFILTRDRVHTY